MGTIDVSLKHTLAAFPQDWAEFLGVPKGASVRIVDSDVSSVATVADKVIEVDRPSPFVLHVEPQAYYDRDLDVRMFEANARLSKRHRRPVHTTVVLLHRQAWGKSNNGRFQAVSPLGDCRVDFRYEVIKVWELPPDKLLTAGLGLLPLASVSAVGRHDVPKVIEKMAERLRQEVPRAVEADLWTATFILVGLRYSPEFAASLLQGVRNIMRESSTYQSIIEEGLAKGLAEGRTVGLIEGRTVGLTEGRTEGRREDILKLGTKRFGEPTPQIHAALSGMNDIARLDTLMDRLLDVSSWDELMKPQRNRKRKA